MKVQKFISDVGGRQFLIELTGLSKGRISQWAIENRMPRAWIKYFNEKFPNECDANGIAIDLLKIEKKTHERRTDVRRSDVRRTSVRRS